jgi:hypothetical protein
LHRCILSNRENPELHRCFRLHINGDDALSLPAWWPSWRLCSPPPNKCSSRWLRRLRLGRSFDIHGRRRGLY